MPEAVPNEAAIQDLKLAFARMEASVSGELRHLSLDLKNFRESLDSFVPRREIEETAKGIKETHENLKERVSRLEGHLSKGAWILAGSWAAGLGVALKVFK